MSEPAIAMGAPLTAGALVSRTFSVWGSNFAPFFALTCIVYAPVIAWSFYIATSLELTPASIDALTWKGYVETLISFVCGAALSGATAYGVMESLRGSRVGFGDVLSVGLSRLLPVLGTSFLAGLAIGVGFLMLVIPGIIVMTMLAAAVPATVIEKTSPGESLRRSAELTKDNRGVIFGAMFLVGLIGIVPAILIQTQVAQKATTLGDVQMAIYLQLGLSLLLAPLSATMGTVVYYELRRRKEGVDAETLAAVFG